MSDTEFRGMSADDVLQVATWLDVRGDSYAVAVGPRSALADACYDAARTLRNEWTAILDRQEGD